MTEGSGGSIKQDRRERQYDPGNCLCREGFGKQMMNLIKIEGHDLIKSCTLPLSRYFSVGHLLILKGYTDFKKTPVL